MTKIHANRSFQILSFQSEKLENFKPFQHKNQHADNSENNTLTPGSKDA